MFAKFVHEFIFAISYLATVFLSNESANVADNACVADLYEQISFLGDLHRQIANTPPNDTTRYQSDLLLDCAGTLATVS